MLSIAPRYVRPLLVVLCLFDLIFAVGFIFRLPFAVRLWPLSYTSPTAFMFVGSIFLAAFASTAWCLLAREDAALTGIGLDYVVILLPQTVFALQLDAGRGGPLRLFGIVSFAGAMFGLWLVLWSIRHPFRDTRPLPGPVRWSFVVFILTLLIAGGALILKVPDLLPWRATAEGSVVYGWMFLGAAVYFGYTLLRPSWHNAAGQLAGFLAYDLVLIGPFIGMIGSINPRWRISLAIYLGVVIYSSLLSIYYLLINPGTRIIRPLRRPTDPATATV